MTEFVHYYIKRRFMAVEITKVPMEGETPAVWGPMGQEYYEREYQIGNFLVREYIMERDEFEYKIVRRENFLQYYLKEPSIDVEQTAEAKSEALGAVDQVAVAYAVTVDGFITIKHRAIRNPRSPSIVWMPEAIWLRLANCATAQGQFYIPCTEAIQSPEQLRALIKQEQENVI